MKKYLKYLCAVLILFGMSVSAWGADPGSGYTKVTSINSLSTGDYVILYSSTSEYGISGIGNCVDGDYVSGYEATLSATEGMWIQYYVTKNNDSFTLKDKAANKFVVRNSNSFTYGDSGTSFTVSNAGGLVESNKSLIATTVFSGKSCERASARWGTPGVLYAIYKLSSDKIKEESNQYTVTPSTMTFTADMDDADNDYYYHSNDFTVTLKYAFGGGVYAELLVDGDDYSYVHTPGNNGYIDSKSANSSQKSSTIYIGVSAYTPNGTYSGYVHVYPTGNNKTTDIEYYIPVTYTVTNSWNVGCDHDVIYDSDAHGSAPSDDSGCENDVISFTPSPNDGYRYNGATIYEDDMTTPITTLNANTTSFSMYDRDVYVVVHYTAQNYTITLNNQSATTAGTTSISVTYGASTNLSGTPAIIVPTKTGNTFNGYYTAINGGGVQIIAANGNVNAEVDDGLNIYTGEEKEWLYAGNINLYAYWTTNSHTLAVENETNITTVTATPSTSSAISKNSSGSVNYGETVTLSYSGISGGYAFKGWDVHETVSGDAVSVTNNQFTMPDANVTVDALLYDKSKLQTRCPDEVEIEIIGSVYLTSYASVPVYTTDNPNNLITVTCTDFGDANKLGIQYLVNGSPVAKASSLFHLCYYDYSGQSNYSLADGSSDGTYDYISLSTAAIKAQYSSGQTFAISYTPAANEYNQTDTYTLRLIALNGSTNIGHEDIELHGRALPQKFVIAANIGGQWKAMPADWETSSSAATTHEPYQITVNSLVNPTQATIAPEEAIYSAANRPTPTQHRGGIRLHTEADDESDGYLQAARSNSSNKLWRTTSDCSTGMQTWYLTSSDFGNYTIGVDKNIKVSSSGTDEGDGDGAAYLNRSLRVYDGKITWSNEGTETFRILPVVKEAETVDLQVVEWKTTGIVFMYLGNPAYKATVEIDGVRKSAEPAVLGTTLKVDHGVYEIDVDDLDEATSTYKSLYVVIWDGEAGHETEIGRKQVTIPMMVTTTTTVDAARLAAGISDKANCHYVDLIVLPNGKLSTGETSEGSKFTFKSVTVYGGGKLIVPAGNYLTAKKMYLRAGSVTATTKGTTPATSYSYVYPQVYIGSGSTLTINENIINFDYLTNYDQYFGVAFPHTAAINKNNITYPDDIYGSAAKTGSYLLRVFDSQIRANQGAVDNVWVDVETGSEAMPKQTNTIRGLGYYALFPPRKVSVNGDDAERQKYGIQRVKMSAESLSNEYADATIDVKAYSAEQPYNAGWWMLGNPYMANLNGGGVGDTEASILVGKIGKNAQGQYEWQDKAVRYVTVPNDDASETYDQRPVSSYTFPAFKPFYVQVGANGRVTFTTTNRVVAAPSRFFNNEMPTEIETAIALNSEAYGDTTHILINNEFTAEYEVGDDLLKMPHANVSLFTISGTTDLFANALNAQLAAEGIPVGYTAPTEGQYTFSYNDKLSTAWIEHLWLIDYVQNSTIDLLESDYTFNATAETNKTRFVLKIELKSGKEDPTTSIDGLIETSPNDGPIKFIYQDKLYIRYNGIIYDAVGKKVSEIK